VCKARSLTGEQGVLIPSTNTKHLMLRQDICDAAEAGEFRVFAATTVDEAITLLTGVEAGERDENGAYPEGTVNQKVEARLKELFELRKAIGAEQNAGESE